MKDAIKGTDYAIMEYLETVSGYRLIELNNKFSEITHYDRIYDNDEEFFNAYFSERPMEAVRAAQNGSYRTSDQYVKLAGDGNLYSFDANRVSDEVDLPQLANHIQEYPEIYNIELVDPEEWEE